MVFNIVLAANLIFLIFFVGVPKKLHLFEILFCSMLTVFLQGTFMAIIILNYKTIQVNPHLFYVWSFVFNRFLLYPLLITWLMDLYLSVRSLGSKITLTLIISSVMVGIEYISNWLKIIHLAPPWKVWWSYAEWLLLIFVLYLFLLWFRKILKKEMIIR